MLKCQSTPSHIMFDWQLYHFDGGLGLTSCSYDTQEYENGRDDNQQTDHIHTSRKGKKVDRVITWAEKLSNLMGEMGITRQSISTGVGKWRNWEKLQKNTEHEWER